MSYQVIARKYRPQTFADLAGQEHIARTLKNSIQNKRLHHAYLFSGVRGTGKTTTARILAKCLNCTSGITSAPCLQCPSCLEIARGNSLDVIEIDAASNTSVDNIREVIVNSISIAPARDRHKIFIIDEVHMLSTSAFNALLKTLEEPPSHVVFMMATTELHKVPDTILSRCQQFEFRQISVDKIFQRLREISDREQVKISDEALHEVARAGNGSLRDAQSALDQVISFSGEEITEQDVVSSLGLVSARILDKTLRAVAEQDTATLLETVGELDSSGHDLRYFTRELMTYLRHVLVIKSGLNNAEVLGISDAEINSLRNLAMNFSEEDLVRFFHLLTETEKLIKDSPHPRFQLEMSLVKITQVLRLRPLVELIRRLEELESKITGGNFAAPASTRVIPDSRSKPDPPPVQRTSPARVETSPVSNSVEEPPEFRASFDSAEAYSAAEPTRTVAAQAVAPAASRSAVPPGRELVAIKAELEKRRKTLVVMALEESRVVYDEGLLTATFANENAFSKRLRESSPLFRELGEQLMGEPLRIEVKIDGTEVAAPVQRVDQERESRLEKVQELPAVKALVEAFRGEIVDVRKLAQ